jgi:hypoxanthine phosphoribosyltransferase
LKEFLLGVISSLAAAGLLSVFTAARILRRRVPFNLFLADVRKLVEQVNHDSGFAPQAVVAINRNGAIVGAILGGLLDSLTTRSPLVIGLSLRRSSGRRETTVNTGLPSFDDIKTAIVVCCVNDTGNALKLATDWLKENEPHVSFKTAALYSTSNSIIHPDYIGRLIHVNQRPSVNKFMTRMPWMTKGWRHDLPDERKP